MSRVQLRPVLNLDRHHILPVQLHRPQVAHRVLLHFLRLLEDLLQLRLPLSCIKSAPVSRLPGQLRRRLVHLARWLLLLGSIPTRHHPLLSSGAHGAPRCCGHSDQVGASSTGLPARGTATWLPVGLSDLSSLCVGVLRVSFLGLGVGASVGARLHPTVIVGPCSSSCLLFLHFQTYIYINLNYFCI